MAAVSTADLPKAQKEELLCTYAALILHDEKIDVTSDNLVKLIKAAGATVEPYLPVLFAQALSDTNIGNLLASASTSGAPSGGARSAVAGESAAPDAKEAEKEPEPEEEEDDMGFSLFD